MKNNKSKKGFTLIEMILVCAIIAIVLGAFTSIVLSATRSYNSFFELSTLENEAIFLENELDKAIKPASSIHILSEVPKTLEEENAYIYSKDGNILIKPIRENISYLYNPYDSIQNITFSAKNDKNILASVYLQKNDTIYTDEFSFPILNELDDFTNEGALSKCLMFGVKNSNSEIEENPLIVSFDFYKDDNSTIDYDCIGVIDNENGIINVEVSSENLSSLVPSISIVGDRIRFFSPNGDDYNISNPKPVDFTSPVNVYVLSGDSFKQYIINVKKIKVDNVVSGGLDIIPTNKEKKFSEDSIFKQVEISESEIYMPNKNNYLNARFTYDEDTYEYNYYVRWYAIEPSYVSSIDDLTKLYNDKKLLPFEIIKNKRYINLNKYQEKVSGKYVFFDVYLEHKDTGNITGEICSLNNSKENDDVLGVVFVGLKNGEVFPTTLNELDFLYSDDFKQGIVLNSFNKLDANKKGFYIYSEEKPYNSYIEDVSDFIEFIKVITPFENEKYTFDVDFFNEEVTITGSSSEFISSSQYAQNGLFSVNMYDKYYSDNRGDYEKPSGVKFGFKNGVQGTKPEIGGVYIAPNAYSVLNKDKTKVRTYGYNINYTYNKSNNFENGVNMNYSIGSQIYGNYSNNGEGDMEALIGQALVGARDISRGDSNKMPYTFKQIQKGDFSIIPSKTNDIIMDIDMAFEKPNEWSNYYSLIKVCLSNGNEEKLKSYPMYFGYYEYFSGEKNYIYGNGYKAKLVDNESQNGSNPVALNSAYLPPYEYNYTNYYPENFTISENLYYTTIGIFGYGMSENQARITITKLTT